LADERCLAVWSERAEQVVRRLMANQPPRDPRVKELADRLGALFAGYDLWSCWFLRPSGEVVIVGEDPDQPESETVHRDRPHVLSALSGASRHYPELSELLPAREPHAVDCVCSEHPQIFGPGKVICAACGGMGWLPPDRPAS
jgi:hypothetical protein